MIFTLGEYILDIDVERTREYYRQEKPLTHYCNCQGCRNYVAWAEALAEEPKTTLERMGIDLINAPEAYVNCRNGDGTLFYGGFYHLCGRILRDTGAANFWAEEALFPLTENFRVSFTGKTDLLGKDFPAPYIQMELLANIPLVLPEKCDYPG